MPAEFARVTNGHLTVPVEFDLVESLADDCRFTAAPGVPVKDGSGRAIGRVLSIEWYGNGIETNIQITDADFYERFVYGRP